MMKIIKKAFVILLLFNFLLINYNVNAVNISKTIRDKKSLPIDIDDSLYSKEQIKSMFVNDHKIESETNLIKNLDRCNFSNTAEEFNPFFSDLLAWYVPYEVLPGLKIDVLCYRIIIENNGADYNFNTNNIIINLDFYSIQDDESEVFLNQSKINFFDFYNEPFEWETGEYIVWIGFLFPENEVTKIKASFEIIEPKNVPDSNEDDNVISVPVAEPVVVDVNVENLKGYGVNEAIVVGYSGTRDNLSVVGKTNKKGEAILYIPPRYPLDQPVEYEIVCDINGKEKTKSTEPLFPGQRTSVGFEFDIKSRVDTIFLGFFDLKMLKEKICKFLKLRVNRL